MIFNFWEFLELNCTESCYLWGWSFLFFKIILNYCKISEKKFWAPSRNQTHDFPITSLDALKFGFENKICVILDLFFENVSGGE